MCGLRMANIFVYSLAKCECELKLWLCVHMHVWNLKIMYINLIREKFSSWNYNVVTYLKSIHKSIQVQCNINIINQVFKLIFFFAQRHLLKLTCDWLDTYSQGNEAKQFAPCPILGSLIMNMSPVSGCKCVWQITNTCFCLSDGSVKSWVYLCHLIKLEKFLLFTQRFQQVIGGYWMGELNVGRVLIFWAH